MKRSLERSRWFGWAVAFGVVGQSSAGLAAGALFSRGGEVSVTQIHAAIVLEESTTALILQVGLAGSGGDLAWVIPTTGVAPALTDLDTPELLRPIATEAPLDAFARLHEVTAARRVVFTEKRRDLGCTELARLRDEPVAAPPWDAYAVQSRELRVLERAASDGVASWLAGRGYVIPLAAADLLGEVAAAGRFFSVVDLGGVEPLGQADERSRAAAPVLLSLRGRQPIIPLLLAQLNAAAPVEVVLYVIGAGRYDVTSYASAELHIGEWLAGEELDEWYAAELDGAFAGHDQPTFVVEHVDTIDLQLVRYLLRRPASVASLGAVNWFVTRFHARLQPDDLDADVELAVRPGDAGKQRLRIRAVDSGEPKHAALPAWGLLLALGVAWRAFRGRR